jgi:hypothetical protein
MDTPKFNTALEQLRWVCDSQDWLYDLILKHEPRYKNPDYKETLDRTQETVSYYEWDFDGDQFEQQVQATDWERDYHW